MKLKELFGILKPNAIVSIWSWNDYTTKEPSHYYDCKVSDANDNSNPFITKEALNAEVTEFYYSEKDRKYYVEVYETIKMPSFYYSIITDTKRGYNWTSPFFHSQVMAFTSALEHLKTTDFFASSEEISIKVNKVDNLSQIILPYGDLAQRLPQVEVRAYE